MTALSSRTIRQALFVAAFAVSISALSTPSFAWSAEARSACMGDVFRVCGAEVPNVDRVTACMVKSRKIVSPGCRVAMDRELTKGSSNVATK
jgi:hypothetical protein